MIPNSSGVVIISTAVLILLDVAPILGLLLFYRAIQICYTRKRRSASWRISIASLLFALLVLAPAHCFVLRGAEGVLQAVIVLAIGTIAYCLSYHKFVRSKLRYDFRILNIAIVWSFIALFTVTALTFIFLGRDHISSNANTIVSYDTLIKAGSILVSAFGIGFTYITGTVQTNRTAQQQLYQTLELQSIELFRFEAKNQDLVKQLWFDGHITNLSVTEDDSMTEYYVKQDSMTEYYVKQDSMTEYYVKQYACQFLNLFEMATRFEMQRVFPDEVFGSWVIWIWSLCQCKRFHDIWKGDFLLNYVSVFREIMDNGVEIACNNDAHEEVQRKEFFILLPIS